MDEVVVGIARRSGVRLAETNGPRVPGDVEVALAEGEQRPGQFVDPVSLGSLIVSAAAFAWQVYRDLKARVDKPSRDVVARNVRVRLQNEGRQLTPDAETVIEVVVDETVSQGEQGEDPPPLA